MLAFQNYMPIYAPDNYRILEKKESTPLKFNMVAEKKWLVRFWYVSHLLKHGCQRYVNRYVIPMKKGEAHLGR